MRIQFYVSKFVADKVERVGTLVGHPKGKAAAFLLDNATQRLDQADQALALREAAAPPTRGRKPNPLGLRSHDPLQQIVLLQVPLGAAASKRVERLAGRRKLSQAKVCAWLLDRSVSDEQWIAGIVTARLVEALAAPTASRADATHTVPTRAASGSSAAKTSAAVSSSPKPAARRRTERGYSPAVTVPVADAAGAECPQSPLVELQD